MGRRAPHGRRRSRCASRILEFEFLSGKMVGMQSMKTWRWDQRLCRDNPRNNGYRSRSKILT